MNTPLKPTADTIVGLINTYINLEKGTALIITTDETSCTELISTGESFDVRDIDVIYATIKILTAGDYYHTVVLPLGDKYIVHNYEIIALSAKTIHIVDS